MPTTLRGSTAACLAALLALASLTTVYAEDKPAAAEPAKPEAPAADAPKADAPKADAPKADAPKADAPKADAPKADAAMEKHIVQYRLAKWETAHFNEAARADKFAATLKQLQCEVQSGPHAGHVDVRYRCPEWKQIVFPTHDAAEKWEVWLEKVKFETKHVH